MRLGTGLLDESRTLQGARTKLANFCSAPLAGFFAAVDSPCARLPLGVINRLFPHMRMVIHIAQEIYYSVGAFDT